MTTPLALANTSATASSIPAAIASIPHACGETPPYVNRGDLPYDYEDLGLNREELQAKFVVAGEHPYHTLELWQSAVTYNRTTQTYWDWVLTEIAADDETY
jgi:hypothetical protein